MSTESAAVKRVDGQQSERRRAVDEDVVVAVDDRGEHRVSRRSRWSVRRELDLRTGQGHRRRTISRPATAVATTSVRHRDVTDDHVVQGRSSGRPVDAEAARGVALGVQVDDQDALTGEGQIGSRD